MRAKIFIIFIIGFCATTFGQTVILSGTQVRQANKGVSLQSNEVILTQNYKIIKVETNANGFWIQSNNRIIATFTKDKGKFSPNPIGYILTKGKYKAFPNLNENQKKAYIKIYLEPL